MTAESALSAEDHAEMVEWIREDRPGLLDLLEEARSATLDVVPEGTFVNPRPLQEAVLAAWLEANYYRAIPPEGSHA